jgi:hypothetical protein
MKNKIVLANKVGSACVNIPPKIPPWNMNERPKENAAREMPRSLISVREKCQNEPV